MTPSELDDIVGPLVRDFTTVMPRTKSEVRRRIMELVEMVRKSERERIRKVIREEHMPMPMRISETTDSSIVFFDGWNCALDSLEEKLKD